MEKVQHLCHRYFTKMISYGVLKFLNLRQFQLIAMLRLISGTCLSPNPSYPLNALSTAINFWLNQKVYVATDHISVTGLEHTYK